MAQHACASCLHVTFDPLHCCPDAFTVGLGAMMAGVPYLLSGLAAFWQQQQQQQQQQQPPLNLNPKPYRCRICQSPADNAAYAQGLADRLRQQRQQHILLQQQLQLQLQTLCNLITSAHGIAPQGAFAGENDVVCAGLRLLIAAALLLQQCPWQLGGMLYHQTSSCHGTTYMSLLFAGDLSSPALLP
jgi:hypothetical protein